MFAISSRSPLALSKFVATPIQQRSLATGAIANPKNSSRERLLILGSGWGGFTCASKIDRSKYDVTVISPTGYFTFTPLLASTSVGTLEFRTALEPVRRLKDVKSFLARASSIDLGAQTITVTSAVPSPTSEYSTSPPPRAVGAPPPNLSKSATSIPRAGEKEPDEKPVEEFVMAYDKLVISVGAFSATFGTPGVYEHAHFLKDVRDARAIRKRILDCFERASQPFVKEKEKRQLLSFRIVGGGPTGVEFAGELHDLISSDMTRIYPDIVQLATINLYDVAPGILLAFDEKLRDYANRQFAREGIVIHPNSKVKEVGDGWMDVEGEGRLPFGLLVWSTGLSPNPLISSLKNVEKDPRSHSLYTNDTLRIIDSTTGKALKDVFAIGDNSVVKNGPRLPATAQVATQKAIALAENLNAMAAGKPETPFGLKNKGSMVYLGQWRGLLDRSAEDVEGVKGTVKGLGAWFMWRSAYWGMCMSNRNRFLLSVYWAINLITGRDISRF